MPKVYNKYNRDAPADAVVVMRPGRWGNPFVIGRDGTRAEVIQKFRLVLEAQPGRIAELKQELRGKDLVCCCAPQPCHADVLLEIANV